ncbi:DUF3896 family protein [Mesobacillus campisalis]|nr:DUF3896 family protein [Mesobacillus campisalis]
MDHLEIKEKLEAIKQDLLNKMENPDLSSEEKANLQLSLMNYEYIIELADMNHFERGTRLP